VGKLQVMISESKAKLWTPSTYFATTTKCYIRGKVRRLCHAEQNEESPLSWLKEWPKPVKAEALEILRPAASE
jgi:hypothetical protein